MRVQQQQQKKIKKQIQRTAKKRNGKRIHLIQS